MFRRVKNLWRLSAFNVAPSKKDTTKTLLKDLIRQLKPKQKLATILEDDPKEMFEVFKENV